MKHARSELENYEIVCRRNSRRVVREIDVPPQETVVPDDSDDEEEQVTLTVKEFYDRFVSVTPEKLALQLSAPQRSPEWLAARKYCITASVFGSANGTNAYCTPDQLVKQKLWDTFKGNYATAYGTAHEDDARFEFESFAKEQFPGCSFEYPNVLKFVECPWIAVSPDGLLRQADGSYELVEFKCPLKQTDAHPYLRYDKCIPPYYMDQIQGIMGHLNDFGYTIRTAWFVVWQDHQTWIMKVPFNEHYWDNILYPALHTWYFSKYLPAAVHQHNGVLNPGEIVPSDPIIL
jgi:putative phage-type endonuclease